MYGIEGGTAAEVSSHIMSCPQLVCASWWRVQPATLSQDVGTATAK